MKKLTYYEDSEHQFLLAYEKTTEFFVCYVAQTGEWEPCGISFSQFRHDYVFSEISEAQLRQKTNGSTPEAAFQRYLQLLRDNGATLF